MDLKSTWILEHNLQHAVDAARGLPAERAPRLEQPLAVARPVELVLARQHLDHLARLYWMNADDAFGRLPILGLSVRARRRRLLKGGGDALALRVVGWAGRRLTVRHLCV